MSKKKHTLLQAISAHIPDLVLGQVVADPSFSPLEWQARMDGSLLFADISGFTAMSETLARLGKEGAEELSRLLNDYFTTMIELVYQFGGQVIQFGGDAILCAFMDPSTNLDTNLLRACGCALRMQSQATRFSAVETRGGVFELQMKIGISLGTVRPLIVGDPDEGLSFLLLGSPLDRVALAEEQATAGEVLLDGEGLAEAGLDWHGMGLVVGEERGTFFLIQDLAPFPKAEGRKPPLGNLREQDLDRVIQALAPYLPPTVYEQISEGQREFVGEHRRVVSMFVNFAGLDSEAPRTHPRLQRYVAAAQQVINRYGGRLNLVSMGDKGSLLHVIFGAPIAYEDNEIRAAHCALALQQTARSLPFITEQRIGIAAGYVFAGNIGSEQCREYTVIGDVVNLSSRLMQAARWGQILLDAQTAQQMETEFVCQELDPIHVKGKRAEILPCALLGTYHQAKVWGADQPAGSLPLSPLVGRERELAQMEEVVEQVADGKGQLLVIRGEAGVGKSRLLTELVQLCRRKGMYGLRGECVSYGSQSPYLPWLDLFHALFGLHPESKEPVAERVHRIEAQMSRADPTLKDWVPLVAQLMGIPLPDNELTASLEPQLRKQRLFDITLTLLKHQAHQAPLFLLAMENVHWIDAISLEMLNYVARNIGDVSMLLVALHRPTIELEEWKRYDNYHLLDLADLPAQDAIRLVQARLQTAEVPLALQNLVLRGEPQVNPLFVEEVLNSLVYRGYLVPRNGGYELVGELAEVEVPESIHALVMSRVDMLDESSKLTTKVASVIGRTFKYKTLEAVYPVEITPERLHRNLNRLQSLNLTVLDRPDELEYVFKHPITQEVVYESLLYSHRRTLHQRIGEYLERTYAGNLDEFYDLLAHHYVQSGDLEKSWHYLIRAGQRAQAQYANEAAIARYTQALSLEIEREESRDVHESLADVYRLIGQYEKALEHYHEALSHPPERMARIYRKISKTWELQSQYDRAMEYLGEALAALRKEPPSTEIARIYNDLGWISSRRGEFGQAIAFCERGLEIVAAMLHREKGLRAQVELEHTLASVYVLQGDHDQAVEHLERCIEGREQIGDLHGLSRSYNNLAVVYWSQGEYDTAAGYIRRSLEISQRIGNPHGMAVCYNNLGVLSFTQRDFVRAVEFYEKSLPISRTLGDTHGIAETYTNLGEVHHQLGNTDRARYYLQEADQLFTEIGSREALFEVYRLMAEVELGAGNGDRASLYAKRSLEVAREVGNQEQEGIALQVAGRAGRAVGRLDEAREGLGRSIVILTEAGNRLEAARSIRELGLTLLEMGDREQGRERLREAARIFEGLGAEDDLDKTQRALVQSGG